MLSGGTRQFPADTLAPWRPREGGPAREAFLTEQLREEEGFSRLMEQARTEDVPMQTLFQEAMCLFSPGLKGDDARTAASRYEKNMRMWREGVDHEGNPLWISLTLSQRQDDEDGIRPESIFPKDAGSAASKSKDKRDGPAVAKHRPLLVRVFQRFFGKKDDVSPGARGEAVSPPRPVRRFSRLILVAVILALLYHICMQRGWVPRIF